MGIIQNNLIEARRLWREGEALWTDDVLDIKLSQLDHLKTISCHIFTLLSIKLADEIKKKDSGSNLLNFFNTNYPKWVYKSRKQDSLIPRQILQSLLLNNSNMTLKQIGAITGGYDHTTILNSNEVVKDMLKTGNENYIKIYEKATKIIKN